MDNVLLYFSLKYNGNWMSIYKALDEKEKIESKELIKVSETIPNNFISIINPLYPSSLKQISEPSFILYFKGSISLLHNYHKTIGFVGGTSLDKYNKNCIENIIKDLVKENRIILLSDETPLQEYIVDCIIKLKGKMIIITSKPLEEYASKSVLLKKNIEETDYVIISEIEKSSMFENQKNISDNLNPKIINGLSKAVVVLETSDNYKIDDFINCSIQEEKKIFAIPQPIYDVKTSSNQIIKQKALLIENAFDILNQI